MKKQFKTIYKTSTKTGKVVIKKENGWVVKFDDYKETKAKAILKKSGIVALVVNLKDLNKDGVLEAPAKDVDVAIALPEIKTTKEITDYFKEKAEGKICGDGLFRTWEQIRNLSYTESVLAGEYNE